MALTTYDELKASIAEEVEYNPETGEFVWLKSGRGRFKRKGEKAGSYRPDGYLSICVNKQQWLSHRLAWLIYYNDEPPKIIDHIDGNKSNNAITNLRVGTDGVNEINSKPSARSPFNIKGIRLSSDKRKYQAYVARRKGFITLYHGDDFFEACCARKSWDAKFLGGKQCR